MNQPKDVGLLTIETTYHKISDIFFSDGLTLDSYEAILLLLVEDMAKRNLMTPDQSQEIQDAIEEVLSEHD